MFPLACSVLSWYMFLSRSYKAFKLLRIGAGSDRPVPRRYSEGASSVEALRKREKGVRENLQFWTIYAVIYLFECYLEVFVAWIPFYWSFKMAVQLWILSPDTSGAKLVFEKILEPKLVPYVSYVEQVVTPYTRTWFAALSGGLMGVAVQTLPWSDREGPMYDALFAHLSLGELESVEHAAREEAARRRARLVQDTPAPIPDEDAAPASTLKGLTRSIQASVASVLSPRKSSASRDAPPPSPPTPTMLMVTQASYYPSRGVVAVPISPPSFVSRNGEEDAVVLVEEDVEELERIERSENERDALLDYLLAESPRRPPPEFRDEDDGGGDYTRALEGASASALSASSPQNISLRVADPPAATPVLRARPAFVSRAESVDAPPPTSGAAYVYTSALAAMALASSKLPWRSPSLQTTKPPSETTAENQASSSGVSSSMAGYPSVSATSFTPLAPMDINQMASRTASPARAGRLPSSPSPTKSPAVSPPRSTAGFLNSIDFRPAAQVLSESPPRSPNGPVTRSRAQRDARLRKQVTYPAARRAPVEIDAVPE